MKSEENKPEYEILWTPLIIVQGTTYTPNEQAIYGKQKSSLVIWCNNILQSETFYYGFFEKILCPTVASLVKGHTKIVNKAWSMQKVSLLFLLVFMSNKTFFAMTSAYLHIMTSWVRLNRLCRKFD